MSVPTPPDPDLRDCRPCGYEALVDRYRLRCLPHWHSSYVASVSRRHTVHAPDGRVTDVYRAGQWPGDDPIVHLVFALRYDGVSLEILAETFEHLGPDPLAEAVRAKPTSAYLRRLWFFYEWLTGDRLNLPDAQRGSYVPALDDRYLAHPAPRHSRRHRVLDNLLGDRDWCPLVRRAGIPGPAEVAALAEETRRLVATCQPELLHRSIAYLYTKETKSSYLIEREEAGGTRMERFIALLRRAGEAPPSKDRLVALQQATVDPRYAESDWRAVQNYVGETQPDFSERLHHVPPRPEDVPSMMDGLLRMAAWMSRRETATPDPITCAAVVSFSFVYIHPFEDGNGRLHRFLVHQLLALRGFTPDDLVLPVSAVLLADQHGYASCLEQISRPLLELIDHRLDEHGRLEVRGRTDRRYRYLDLTRQASDLIRWIRRTVAEELPAELRLLADWDAALQRMAEVVDMPQRKRHLFIRLCRQNGGRLSDRKRRRFFPELADHEVAGLEQALAGVFAADGERAIPG